MIGALAAVLHMMQHARSAESLKRAWSSWQRCTRRDTLQLLQITPGSSRRRADGRKNPARLAHNNSKQLETVTLQFSQSRVSVQLGKQHNFDRALELFIELQMGNMDPTRIVVSAFLGACVENSRPRSARQLIEVSSSCISLHSRLRGLAITDPAVLHVAQHVCRLTRPATVSLSSWACPHEPVVAFLRQRS